MIDTDPLILACRTRIYRAVFTNKQADCWYSTSFPVEGECSDEPFDLRRGIAPQAPLKFLSPEEYSRAQSMTLLELRRNCLQSLLNRS